MKIKLSANNIDEAQSVNAAQSGIRAFSKVVELGHDYRLIIPVDPASIANNRPSLMSASFPVRNLDRFVKGSTYILEDWDADEMTGRYIDNTPLAHYESISRVIHKAECKKAKRKKERELRADASDSGDDVNSEAFIGKLAIELNNIDRQYYGDSKAEPKVYATKKPLVGGVRTYTCTEFYVVPINDEVPDYKNAEIAGYDITSGIKLTKLKNAFKSAYKAGDKFVELHIRYGYNCSKASEAGQALTFEAVKDEDRLSAKTPEKWQTFEPELEKLAKSAEQIAARSLAARYNQPADHLIAAYKEYLATLPGIFKFVDFEDQSTKYAAKYILDEGLASEATVQEQLLALVGDDSASEVEDVEDEQEDFNAAAVSRATNLDELEEAVVSTSSTGDLSALDSEDLSLM